MSRGPGLERSALAPSGSPGAPATLPAGVLALGALFVVTGTLHFLRPGTFDQIVPPGTPLPARTATLLSGAAEIAGGLGLLLPTTRPAARWGLLALLLAVFPANVYMAQHPERIGLPAWALWARLPLQPLLMWWVWRVGRQTRPDDEAARVA